jgi:PhnB protein
MTANTQTITPYLSVSDGQAALQWYTMHFRATATDVMEWEGKLGHSELEFSGARFYLSNSYPDIGVISPADHPGGNSCAFVVNVDNADTFIARCVQGGATLQRPIDDSNGARNGWIIDPFGHRWNLRTPTS